MTSRVARLEHAERVAHVVVESRGGSDKWDRRTRERLRRSHQISLAVRVDHARKRADGRLRLADFVAGAYFGALVHGDTEPWTIVSPTCSSVAW